MTTPTLTKDLHKVMTHRTFTYRGCYIREERTGFTFNNKYLPSYRELDLEIERVMKVIATSIKKS